MPTTNKNICVNQKSKCYICFSKLNLHQKIRARCETFLKWICERMCLSLMCFIVCVGEGRSGACPAVVSWSSGWWRSLGVRMSPSCRPAPPCSLRMYRWGSLCVWMVTQLPALLPETVQGLSLKWLVFFFILMNRISLCVCCVGAQGSVGCALSFGSHCHGHSVYSAGHRPPPGHQR